MATLKALSRSKRSETLSKGLMVDTWRGILRVRKWPRKRGTPKSPLQLWWIDWFRQANKLAKYADGMSQARAIEITKDSGMYPRDVLLSAMRGRLYIWQDQTGKVWYPMAAVQDISESLDVLAQSIGSILTRSTDRWRAVADGDPGDVLTNQGAGNPAAWAPVTGAGGFVGGALVSKSANQSINSGASTVLSWDVETYDTAGLHDNVTNNSRMTVPVGTTWVRLSMGVLWQSNSTGSRILLFAKNGSFAFAGARASRQSAYNGSQHFLVSPPLAVVAGDYFEAAAYQDSGSAKNVLTYDLTNFNMELL